KETGLFNQEFRVVIDFVPVINFQDNGDAFSIVGQLDVRYGADLHASEQDAGALFESANVGSVQSQFISAMEQAGALAEQDQGAGEQHQADQYEQAHFDCNPLVFHF